MKWLLEAKGNSQEKRAAVSCEQSTLKAAASGCASLVKRARAGHQQPYYTWVSILGDLGLNPNFTT